MKQNSHAQKLLIGNAAQRFLAQVTGKPVIISTPTRDAGYTTHPECHVPAPSSKSSR